MPLTTAEATRGISPITPWIIMPRVAIIDAAEATRDAEKVAKPAPAIIRPAPRAAIPMPINATAPANANNGPTTALAP